jgi:hypothetical protein
MSDDMSDEEIRAMVQTERYPLLLLLVDNHARLFGARGLQDNFPHHSFRDQEAWSRICDRLTPVLYFSGMDRPQGIVVQALLDPL